MGGYADSFEFLHAFWPDLHILAVEAEQNSEKLPIFSAIRLRSFAETMVRHLFDYHTLPFNSDESQFNRLQRLQQEDLLAPRILAIFHTIRKLGNNAAHNRPVSVEQAGNLIDDAWSLSAWFCRHMRPDLEWNPKRLIFLSAISPPPETPAEDTTARAVSGDDAVAIPATVAAAETDPQTGPPRTRIALREAFEDELTDDQQRCILALEAFLADDSQRVFLLKGYAGTGKTFLAAGLTEFLLTQGRRFSLAAPTGRAAKVIAKKTGQSACTIHRLIYDHSDMTEQTEDGDDGSATFKMIAKVRHNEDPVDAVCVVDEASLVSDVYSESEYFRSGSGHLLRDLIAYVGSTHSGNARKIIFIGDPAQLPPVGMSSSPALDADYLRGEFGLDAVSYELTKIVRQKADSAVIRNVTPLREGVVSGRFSSLSFTFDDDVIQLNKDSVTPLYMRIREGRGPQAPVIVTRSNAEATTFNRAIRALLFPGRDVVAKGDTVIAAANRVCEGNLVANGEILRIEVIEPAVERRTVRIRRKITHAELSEILDVALDFRGVTVALPQPDGDDLILKVKILDSFLHGDDGSLDAVTQQALYVDFLQRHRHIHRKREPDKFILALRSDPYFNALLLRFGYAITCHKAQGGGWSHVIVSCATRENPRSSNYFRWLYTAMTRTSDKLYLVDPPKIVLVPAGGWNPPSPSGPATPNGNPGADAGGFRPGPSGSPAEGLSPQALFRQGLQAEIRSRLDGTGIEIENIAHHQYREAYSFKRGAEAVRIDISYKGNWTISGITCPRPDSFAEDVMARLATLIGQKLGTDTTGTLTVDEPNRPFLKDFHDRLLIALAQKDIRVAGLKEQAWSQRYILARAADSVSVDIYYNRRDRLNRFMPVNPSQNPTPSLVGLQNDVLHILTKVVRP